MKRRTVFGTILSLALLSALALPAPASAASIKVGALIDLSGPAAAIGIPTKLVAQMVTDKINKEGGINGSPIELILGDTESDPTKALMVAKRLVENDKVVALIGPTRTDTGMAVKPYIEKAGIPTVMCIGGDRIILGGQFGAFRWTFKVPQRTATAVEKIYVYLKSQKIEKVALFTTSDGFGKDGLAALQDLAPKYGLTIAASESFAATDTDMTTQLVKMRDSGAGAIVTWCIGPAGARVAKNARQIGLATPLFQSHGIPDPKYVELAGDAANGTIMPSTKLMVVDQLAKSDPQKAVIEEFVKLYRDQYKFDKEYPINTHSGYAWDAVYILANAMKKAGTDPEKLRAALEQTKGFVGVSGIFTMTPEDHNGLHLDSMVIVKVADGKWQLLQN